MGKRAVVIGSGFGGLSIAIRLQARGLKVTLLEKRDKIGGRAYQFEEKGYMFDMGPTLITSPEIIESVFRAAGRKREEFFPLLPLDPYYRVYFHDGSFIDYCGDVENMKQEMAQFEPRDAHNYESFLDAIKPIYDTIIGEGYGAKPFDTLGSMLSFVPRIIKLGAYWPVHHFVKRYFRDFRHQFLFSFHPLFIGGNPFVVPSIYLMIPFLEKAEGVWFAPGGMYTFVKSLAQVFEELGGTIETSCEVTKIEVEGGAATGVHANGQFYEADLVVSNADTAWTYKKLIAPEHRKRWTDKKIEKTSYTMSCYLLYLGTRKQYPQLKHHTLILSARYKELIKDIFDNKIIPDDFSMYLHAPTRTDPDMAPDGCESMYVLIPVANLQSGVDWKTFEPTFTEKIIDFLENWGLEDLRENIEVQRTFTPEDFATELLAFRGNAFGIEPKLTQTAYFRPHNRSKDVKGLYIVGAGTHPGAGVPGVLLSAEATESCIVEDLGLQKGPMSSD